MAAPFDAGAFHATLISVLPPAPHTASGAAGTPVGVAEVLAVAVPSPMALTALIWMLYAVPLVNAVLPFVLKVEITSGDAVVPAARVLNVVPPSVEYLKLVIVEPPVAPSVNATDSDALDAVIALIVGADGVVDGIIADEEVE